MTPPTPHLTKHCVVNVQEFCDLAIVFLHLLTNNNEDIGPQNAPPPFLLTLKSVYLPVK